MDCDVIVQLTHSQNNLLVHNLDALLACAYLKLIFLLSISLI